MINKIKQSVNDPIKTYNVVKAITKGFIYKTWYQHILRKATFGKNFKVFEKMSINGPGKVHFGDNVRLGMVVTPWTEHPDAIITIGDRTFLNGTRFSCVEKITVGDDCVLADCRLLDSDFHGTDPAHRDQFKSSPIEIGNNVWITLQSVILKGVKIGNGSTVTANSVVIRSVPPNTIVGGNPSKHIKEAI